MATMDGIRSFGSLRSRARPVTFGGHDVLVGALRDIIKSKERAGREQDLAVLSMLRRTLDEQGES